MDNWIDFSAYKNRLNLKGKQKKFNESEYKSITILNWRNRYQPDFAMYRLQFIVREFV